MTRRDAAATRRRPAAGTRRRLAAGLGLLVLLLSVAPLYPRIGGVRPFVFSMPFSMFWLVLLIAAVFFTFLALFLSEREEDEALDREYRSAGESERNPPDAPEGT